jgi:hypothetical protein
MYSTAASREGEGGGRGRAVEGAGPFRLVVSVVVSVVFLAQGRLRGMVGWRMLPFEVSDEGNNLCHVEKSYC